MKLIRSGRSPLPFHGFLIAAAAMSTGSGSALLGVCGPFGDVAADAFCPFVLEVFYVGITTGTTPTTYDPTANVSRLQMAAFLSRTVDRTLQRAGRRAALGQLWTTKATGLTPTGRPEPGLCSIRRLRRLGVQQRGQHDYPCPGERRKGA